MRVAGGWRVLGFRPWRGGQTASSRAVWGGVGSNNLNNGENKDYHREGWGSRMLPFPNSCLGGSHPGRIQAPHHWMDICLCPPVDCERRWGGGIRG